MIVKEGDFDDMNTVSTLYDQNLITVCCSQASQSFKIRSMLKSTASHAWLSNIFTLLLFSLPPMLRQSPNCSSSNLPCPEI